MNLLSLIIIFLAVVICGAVAFIAWELTSEAGPDNESPAPGRGEGIAADSSRDNGPSSDAGDGTAGNSRD